MNLKQVKEMIGSMMDNEITDINICLEGHQGIGKTQILKQLADEKGWDYKAVYCAQTSTEDLMGMPWIDKVENVTRFARPKLFPDKPKTIFVLEEINRAPLEVQQSVLQLLTDKKIGDFVLPEKTLICSCINPTESMYQTQELDSVFINRLVKIPVTTSPKEWIEYAKSKGFNEDIIAFIKSLNKNEVPIYFTQLPSEKNIGKPIPSPRTWEIANKILNLNLDDANLLSMLSGAIGEQAATRFLAVRTTLKNMVDCEDVFKDYSKVKSKINKLNDSEMYKLINDLTAKIKAIKTIEDYKDKYNDEGIKSLGDFILDLCNNHKAMVGVMLSNISPVEDKTLVEVFKQYEIDYGTNILVTVAEIINQENN